MKMTRWLVKEKQSVRTFCLAATWKVQKSAFQASFHCFVINPQLAPAFGCQFPSFVLAKAPVQQLCGYGLLYHGSHYVKRSIFVRKLSTSLNIYVKLIKSMDIYWTIQVTLKSSLRSLVGSNLHWAQVLTISMSFFWFLNFWTKNEFQHSVRLKGGRRRAVSEAYFSVPISAQ